MLCGVNSGDKKMQNQGFDQFAWGAVGSKRVVLLRETLDAEPICVVVFSQQQAHPGGFKTSFNFGSKRRKKGKNNNNMISSCENIIRWLEKSEGA